MGQNEQRPVGRVIRSWAFWKQRDRGPSPVPPRPPAFTPLNKWPSGDVGALLPPRSAGGQGPGCVIRLPRRILSFPAFCYRPQRWEPGRFCAKEGGFRLDGSSAKDQDRKVCGAHHNQPQHTGWAEYTPSAPGSAPHTLQTSPCQELPSLGRVHSSTLRNRRRGARGRGWSSQGTALEQGYHLALSLTTWVAHTLSPAFSKPTSPQV